MAIEQALAERVVDRVEDDDPARRRAALARVRERRGERPRHGVVEVGVVADDERVLAAELEAHLREPARRRLVDRPPGRGRAREADEVDVGMLDERRARFGSEPVDDVEHAGRNAGLQRELREERRRRGRVLGGLHDRSVPAEDRRERLPGDVRERRVEAHDQRRDAERLPHGQHRPVRHARGRRAAVRPSPLAGDEEPHLHRRVRLAERELRGLARLLRDDRRCLLAPLAQEERELADDVAAGDRRARRPLRLRGPCGSDRGPSTSSAPERATRQSSVSSAGRSLSSHSPVEGATSDPSMRFGTCSGITRPTSRRRRRRSSR